MKMEIEQAITKLVKVFKDNPKIPIKIDFIGCTSYRRQKIQLKYKKHQYEGWLGEVSQFYIEKDISKYKEFLMPLEIAGSISYATGFSGQVRKYFMSPCVLAYMSTPHSVCYIYKTKRKLAAAQIFQRRWECVLESIPIEDAYKIINKADEVAFQKVPEDVENLILAKQL